MERFENQGRLSRTGLDPGACSPELGLAPDSRVEWCVQGDEVVVRRTGKYTSRDIHDALFVTPPAPQTVDAMKDGIRAHLRRKHARGSCYDAEPPRRGG